MKKIAIIGVGGRTGTMFAFELRNSAEILGVGKEKEAQMINEKRVYVDSKGKINLFKARVMKDFEFKEELQPEIIFLTTKNPIELIIKYYYQKFKEKVPDLLISQNGISAMEDAQKTLKEILGEKFEKIRLIRIILFNPIEKSEREGQIYIKYAWPIRIALAKVSGSGEIKDVVEIFQKSGMEVKEFPLKQAKNLEFSKLFLNLIGMASASRGFSIEEGFKEKEVFKEEIKAIREYIKIVKVAGGDFLNFPHYPVNFLTILFQLPIIFLLPWRNILAKIISKERIGKPKELDEIDYYNGAVVRLGRKLKIKTPVNEKIYKSGRVRIQT